MAGFLGVIALAGQYSALAGIGGAAPIIYLLKRLVDEFFHQLHRQQDRRDREWQEEQEQRKREREEERARRAKEDRIKALTDLENKVSLWINLVDRGHGNLRARPFVEGARELSKALAEFQVERRDLTDNQITGYSQHLDNSLTLDSHYSPHRVMFPNEDFVACR